MPWKMRGENQLLPSRMFSRIPALAFFLATFIFIVKFRSECCPACVLRCHSSFCFVLFCTIHLLVTLINLSFLLTYAQDGKAKKGIVMTRLEWPRWPKRKSFNDWWTICFWATGTMDRHKKSDQLKPHRPSWRQTHLLMPLQFFSG